ncbi:3-oxoacyl-[acyl-carrier-protein] reductase [uncultured Rummeliibacillus sp.]|uniref:3-oxoacyl-[acyl-carrier-protein] reductase n=1 Tax=uncultured Rummeliibacillus sp. TaxID=762292 RepID=UPI000E674603|nr:3-oxoacyl-[acyl-carrier-protein] reductase [Rummeliibacillus sp. POC4]RIJ67128.1 3-oxoacyl-[acyl-carrier-protein] reductase [Rummeliibacillus sp. POC4]
MSAIELKELGQVNYLKPLANKVAIVTGASRGIGAEIAKVLAKNGATVVATYSSSEVEMQKIIQEIEEQGGQAIAVKANVSELEDSRRLIDEVLKQFTKVDILINNAGITKDRSFRKMSKDEWDQVINVNLNGIFHTTSAVINHMIDRKYGRIINISSIIGQAGGFGQTNYAASKAGILGFTKSLALETAKSGITVNAVCPGFIETEMVAAMPEKVKNNIIAKVPMQRLGTTSEIAEAVLYLIQASFVTGQEINVNGGLYM